MVKKIVFSSIAVLVVLVGLFFYRLHTEWNQMRIDTSKVIIDEIPDTDEPEYRTQEEDNLPPREDFYTLIIGLDTRDSSFQLNTDSLIVAHVIPQDNLIKLISIPRDQMVYDLNGEKAKINAIFGQGYTQAVKAAKKDPSLLSGTRITLGKARVHEEYLSSGIYAIRRSVEKLLTIDIDYSYLVHFEAVIKLVDKVGGLEIDVDRDMEYDDSQDGTHIHLKKGLQHLDGLNTLNFVRFRQDNRGEKYYSSDLERGIRQQQVLSALANKITNWGSIARSLDLLDIVTSNVKTDMPRDKMVTFVRKFYGTMAGDSIISIPYKGEWKYPYVDIDTADLLELREQFKSIEQTTEQSAETDKATTP